MRVLAVAGDAGGAHALAPVIRRLVRTDRATVECQAYGAAVGVWKAAGLSARGVTGAEVGSFDRILLGTSVAEPQWELRVIARARECRVPTLSVLDFWTNYRQRFTSADGGFVLPEAIAVMDEQAKAEMIAMGFSGDRLHVTGHPAFDGLARYDAPGVRSEAAARVRRLVGVGGPCVLFVSQPLSRLRAKETLGFDEGDVLPALTEVLGDVLERRSRPGCLLVKRHPGEADGPVPAAPSALRVRVVAGLDPDPRGLMLGSDLVVGMNSMLLMEACFLRKPVVSYQPNLRESDPLPANRHGWSRAVYARPDLAMALEAELFDPEAQRERETRLARVRVPQGATERVLTLLQRMRN